MFLLYGNDEATAGVSTVSSFTVPVDTAFVAIQASGAEIRFTCDGSLPTTTNGIRLIVGKKPRILLGTDFQNIRYTRGSGTDGVLHAHFYGGREVELGGGGGGGSDEMNWIWQDGSQRIWQDGSDAMWAD